MYNTILLATALQKWERYSAHALAARDVALVMAQSTSKHLHVLSAYEYDHVRPTELPVEIAAKLREEQTQRTDSLMAQKIAAYIAPLKAEGLTVESILRVGNPRDVIVQVATDLEADLLIIGSHSKRGFLDIALGGTAQQISKYAPCPVVMVSPKH